MRQHVLLQSARADYAAKLFELFGKERVEAELEEHLATPFFLGSVEALVLRGWRARMVL
jgi:hypothetical protein